MWAKHSSSSAVSLGSIISPCVLDTRHKQIGCYCICMKADEYPPISIFMNWVGRIGNLVQLSTSTYIECWQCLPCGKLHRLRQFKSNSIQINTLWWTGDLVANCQLGWASASRDLAKIYICIYFCYMNRTRDAMDHKTHRSNLIMIFESRIGSFFRSAKRTKWLVTLCSVCSHQMY